MNLRSVYPTWQEAVRQIAIFANFHTHSPYSKPGTASSSTSLDEDNHTVSVTASGLTITLPQANERIVGQDWTVHLGVAGTVTVQRAGSDTICTPYSASDTSVQLITLGDSITFRCLSATTWGMV